MFRFFATTLFALLLSSIPALAAPSKGIFKGSYDGITSIENAVGTRIFYSPVRFTINQAGKVSGTAFNTRTRKLLTVTGQIQTVRSLFGIRFYGDASGKFSDGTRWTAEIEANKGISGKIFKGTARRGSYSGPMSLTSP